MGVLVKLSAKIEDNTIQDIAFQAYGGGAMIASMSLLIEKTKGKKIDEALLITPSILSEELLLDSSKIIYPMIAIESIHKMLQNKL